jgi:hypothetical protein
VFDALDGSTKYDAILLDVDNGPIGETLEANSRLYEDWSLMRTRDALRRGGLLAGPAGIGYRVRGRPGAPAGRSSSGPSARSALRCRGGP